MLVHKMRLDDHMAVLDVNSGAVHLVDDVIYDLLDYYKGDNAQEAIDAFHRWYDAAVRFLGKHFEESDTSYKQILDIDAGGNGYVLHSEFNRICSKVHLLMDKVISVGNANNVTIQKNSSSLSNKIFIVHGHDNEMKESVARLISSMGLEPIILSEQPNCGPTIIEKIEKNSDVGAAICLFTADDECKNGTNRARQNVVLETGYFWGKLGRDKMVILADKGVELPSDMQGVVYTDTANWEFSVCKELKQMGYDIDLNRIV